MVRPGNQQGNDMNRSIGILVAGALAAGLNGPAAAQGESGLDRILKEAKPLLNVRLRYESVDQAGIARDADAVTSRVRAGFETGAIADTKFLGEFDWTAAISEKYNSTVNGKTQYPVVADPDGAELNRLQLTNTSLPATKITLGRQVVNLDDQRFVGSVAWRQNDQTLDAVRVENSAIRNLTLTGLYVIQTNRVFGADSPVGRIEGDTVLLNAAYKTPFGVFSGFAYWIDFEGLDSLSSRTLGVRFAGAKKMAPVTLAYQLSYAHQNDAYANPFTYKADYYLVDVSLGAAGFNVGAGYEVLSGDGARAFQTPLATLHKFQGWADKFLTTPGNGIKDFYVSAGYTSKPVGLFSSIGAMAVYHDFRAERGGAHYGDEIDLQLVGKIGKYTITAKYADYNARTFATDTSKFWMSIEYAF